MNTKKISLWALLIIAVGALIFFMYKYGGEEGRDTAPSTLPEVSTTDYVQGNQNAKATLIEYADFQCPACQSFVPVLQQLLKDESDKLRIVYRYFPLIQVHRNAMSSSLAAEAAARQGKFWEMHDILFKNQSAWAESASAPDMFAGYAQQIGLDVNKYKADVNSSEVKSRIQTSIETASNMGLNHTPTFFLNGKEIETPTTLQDFETLINQAAQ